MNEKEMKAVWLKKNKKDEELMKMRNKNNEWKNEK